MARSGSCGDPFLHGCSCEIGIRCAGVGIEGEKRCLGDRRADLRQKGEETVLEDLDTKILGVSAQNSWRPFDAFETDDRSSQVCRLLAIEKDARDAIYDGLDCPSCTIGNGRPAGGGNLKGRHTKVLFPGEYECPAACSIMLHFPIGEPPEKGDGWARIGHEPCAIRPIPNDQHPPPNCVQARTARSMRL